MSNFSIQPYIPLGWTDATTSLELVSLLYNTGVTGIFVGWALSDPLFNTRSVRAAAVETLALGFTLERALDLVSRIKHRHPGLSITWIIHYQLLIAKGISELANSANNSGVNEVLVIDLPKDKQVASILHAHKVATAFVISSDTPTHEITNMLDYRPTTLFCTELPPNLPSDLNIPLHLLADPTNKQELQTIQQQGFHSVIPSSRIIELVNLGLSAGDPLEKLRSYITELVLD